LNIANNNKKFLTAIQRSYAKAPYIEQIFPILQDIINYPDKNLASFIFNHIQKICNYLVIKPKLILSSLIKKNNELKGEEKIINICKKFNTSIYINAIDGQKLYDKEKFEKEGIKLQFLQTKTLEYKQFDNHFIPNLSIIDLMMFNSKNQLKKMLNSYRFI